MNKKSNEAEELTTQDIQLILGKYYFSQLDEAGKKRIMDNAVVLLNKMMHKDNTSFSEASFFNVFNIYIDYISSISYYEYTANFISEEQADELMSVLDKRDFGPKNKDNNE